MLLMGLQNEQEDNLSYYIFRHFSITESVRTVVRYLDIVLFACMSLRQIEGKCLHADGGIDLAFIWW